MGRFALHVTFLVTMVLGALLARAFVIPQASGFSPWYPPAGLLMGYLVVAGWRWAPVAVLGRLLAVWVVDVDLLVDDPAGLVAKAVAVVVVYTLAAEVLRRVGVARLGVAETAWFMAVGLGAGPGLATLAFNGLDVWISGGGWSETSLRTYWVGDAVAVATIVPPIVAVEAWWRGGRRSLNRRVVAESEQMAVALALVGIPIAAFTLASGNMAWYGPFALLPVLWVAFRSEPVAATAGLLLTNLLTALAVRTELGPTLSVLQAQMLMLSAASAGLAILAISVDQRHRLTELIAREERYATLVAHSPATVIRFSAKGAILPLGMTRAPEAIADGLVRQWESFGPQTIETGAARVITWTAGEPDSPQFYVTNIAAEPTGDDGLGAVLTVTSDVTASQEAEAEFSVRLRTDGLTGLANREHVMSTIDGVLAEGGRPVGVAVIDIDGFRSINQRAGYVGGDRILIDVGSRLTTSVRDLDLVGRMGDDEFVVVLSDPIGPDDAGRVMDRVLHGVRTAGSAHGLVMTASIGVAFASPGMTAKQLVDEARSAMDLRRSGGGDGWTMFDDAMRSGLGRTRRLAAELRSALDTGELHFAYQPVVLLADRSVVGFEVLVRWVRPDGESVSPEVFIPLAERVGLIGAITEQALGDAVRQLADWDAAGIDRYHVSVNVSAGDLLDAEFCERLLAIVRGAGIDPARLRLELTETAVLTNPERAVEVLGVLRQAGLTIVLDDFGTGYSSLALLRQLPVDVMKIDQSFVVGLPDPSDAAVVQLILGMAETLQVGVVAEGIETEEQLEFLQAAGCRVGQGYLFAKPATPAELDRLVAAATAAG